MKLKIYYGKEKPIIAIGKNQCRILEFAEKFRCWHSFNEKDEAAIKALEKQGCLSVDWKYSNYKFQYPN